MQNTSLTCADTHSRSVIKAITWRIVATAIALAVLYFFTKEASTSIEMTIFLAIFSTIAYYIHERIWDVSRWGRTHS